jgi:enoyl-CoA hydratase
VPLIDGGTWRLPRVVGTGRALDLILTGRAVGADEALAMGLVTLVADDPVARAVELAESIAAHPQPTMLSDRASVYDGWGHPLPDALAIEMRHGLGVLAVGREGAQDFVGGAGRGGAGTA